MEKPKSFKSSTTEFLAVLWEDKEIQAFVVAASRKNSSLDVIYHLLRRDLDLSPLASWSSIAKGDDIF